MVKVEASAANEPPSTEKNDWATPESPPEEIGSSAARPNSVAVKAKTWAPLKKSDGCAVTDTIGLVMSTKTGTLCVGSRFPALSVALKLKVCKPSTGPIAPKWTCVTPPSRPALSMAAVTKATPETIVEDELSTAVMVKLVPEATNTSFDAPAKEALL